MKLNLTDQQIKTVRKTWILFRAMNADLITDAFYTKLFSDTPSLRHSLSSHLSKDSRNLIDILSIIISQLDKPDELKRSFTRIMPHPDYYGLRPGHFKVAGKALFWTLEQGLGSDWNPAVQSAWENCYAEFIKNI